MNLKVFISALSTLIVGMTYAATLTVTSVDVVVAVEAKANAISDGTSDTFHSLIQANEGIAVDGAQSAYAATYGEINDTGFDYVSGTSQSYAEANSAGLGAASGSASIVQTVNFHLSDAATLDYNFSVLSQSSSDRNSAGMILQSSNEGFAGGGPFQLAGLGEFTSGNILLAAGDYSLQIFTATSTSLASDANGSASGSGYTFSNWSVSAQAVPEPATMAVFGLGAAVLARRRRR
jgi:hypothetical protein